jgi:alpha-D-ribose 1-methylphosphonate 5-triphosphate diphosphatase
MSIALTHLTAVTREAVIHDTAVIIGDDGCIAAVDPLSTGDSEIWPCHGRLLVPGIVDLHCDAIEKVVQPRPNARFPTQLAMDQIDRVNAAAGVTTVFHALSFGQDEARTDPLPLVDGIGWLSGRSLVAHRLHCRYEIASTEAFDQIRALIGAGRVDLVSIMDHTPGQGQFKDIEAFVAYYTQAHALTRDEALATARDKAEQRGGGHVRALELTTACHRAGIPVASHDDDSPERAAAVHAGGVGIAEFPITLETARAAKALGMVTILGAPNILRGGSQSGSMRALDAVIDGCCDCLCADYAPWTLLPAALALPELAGIDLAAAFRLVSANPAEATALSDRGCIAPGKRADLLLVAPDAGGSPRIEAAWCGGRLIGRQEYPVAVTVPA